MFIESRPCRRALLCESGTSLGRGVPLGQGHWSKLVVGDVHEEYHCKGIWMSKIKSQNSAH